ncbi:hypothetical protein HOLleu_08632 [Holothuria leucospilota]|uniref:Uncharacterized protein n=1 Tax=Holothuria leucospilota TaxID=206669 RepID=A0A9Q1CJ91_HOLLE|nr:hypothetical protein HOLleu_08632 [Holothuria leucospilota]
MLGHHGFFWNRAYIIETSMHFCILVFLSFFFVEGIRLEKLWLFWFLYPITFY